MLTTLGDAPLDTAFGKTSIAFRHGFIGRSELTIDALGSVVGRIPASWVYAHEAQHSPHEGRGAEPPLVDCSITEVVTGIADSHASVRVYNLERTAEYGALADTLRSLVSDYVGVREGGVEAINLGAFVASPGAVTPAHPDRHHNLLLQVHGRKEIWIEDDADARAGHVRVLDYLRCPPAGIAVLPPARSLVLEPGDGVYIPPYAFHWTRLFDEPGVALSIGFSTAETMQRSDAHEFDLRLRRFGWRPRPARAESRMGKAKSRLGVACVQRSVRRHPQPVTVGASQEGTDE